MARALLETSEVERARLLEAELLPARAAQDEEWDAVRAEAIQDLDSRVNNLQEENVATTRYLQLIRIMNIT